MPPTMVKMQKGRRTKREFWIGNHKTNISTFYTNATTEPGKKRPYPTQNNPQNCSLVPQPQQPVKTADSVLKLYSLRHIQFDTNNL